MDLFIGSRSLARKLIARDVDHFESLLMIFLIHLFDGFVMRGESASGRRVDDQHDFALIIRELDLCSVGCRYAVIIDACHGRLLSSVRLLPELFFEPVARIVAQTAI